MHALKILLLAVTVTALSGCAMVPGLNIGADGTVAGRGAQTSGADARTGTEGTDVAYRLIEVNDRSLPAIRSETEATGAGHAPPLAGITPKTVPDEYRVGPGDILHITVWEHPELTIPTGQTLGDLAAAGRVVSAAGLLYYPYVGEFKAAGMTVVELRKLLAKKLTRVIAQPQVDARVISFRAQRIQVAGEVRSPGTVTLDDTPKGVMEAINERGGLSPTASRRTAFLTRNGKTHKLDMAALFSGDDAALNPKLEAGDVLAIPDQSHDMVFVLGEVERQMPVTLQQGRTTLIEALTTAGGLDKLRANDSGLLIFRRPPRSGDLPSIYSLDMDSPIGLLLAGEFVLQPRDVVYVKATEFAKYNSIINQLLPTISAVFQLDRLTDRN